MYRKPNFIAGKEVPHRKPAKPVSSNAFFLLSKTLGARKKYSFLFEKEQ
jgi:hypothetical protein